MEMYVANVFFKWKENIYFKSLRTWYVLFRENMIGEAKITLSSTDKI